MILAVTGSTGFVGGHLLDQALAAGHHVRALTRRPQPPREGVTWIEGDLARPGALMEGADAAIHVAGVVNAPDRAGFAAGNVDGTASIVAAATSTGVNRFVHVSSLAAREPQLSDYGSSKAEAERIVDTSRLHWTIVRPPGVFGPGDTETLPLFRAAARHLVPVPPAGGRGSWIYVSDLAALLVRLAVDGDHAGRILEPDDGTPNGWDHRDFARAIGASMGKRVLPLPLPRAALLVASAVGRRLGGPLAKLTRDRVGYLVHPDWVSHPNVTTEPAFFPSPTIDALAQTARWYRAHGLL